MEKLVVNLNTNKCSVIFFGDVHVGNYGCDFSAIERMNKYIVMLKKQMGDDPLIVVGMGDYIDAITLDDKRYQPDELDERYPQKDVARSQMKHFYELTKPTWDIADIGIAVLGNHEEKFIQKKSFDVYSYLTEDLSGGKIKKAGYEAILRLILKRGNAYFTYDIYITHGAGGSGWREGSVLNAVYDISRFYDADCFVVGHWHRLVSKTSAHLYLNTRHELKEKRKHYGCSGSFLLRHTEGHRNYMEGRRGEPTLLGFLQLDIAEDRKGNVHSTLKEIIL